MKGEIIKAKPKVKKRVFLMIAISGLFFLMGMQLFTPIFEFLVPQVKGVIVINTDMSTMFKLSLLMGFAFAIIPFAVNSGWQLLKLESTPMKAFFAFILLCGPTAAIIIRGKMLENMAKEMYISGVFSPIHIGQIKAAEFVMMGTVGAWILGMAMFAAFKKKPTVDSSPKTR